MYRGGRDGDQQRVRRKFHWWPFVCVCVCMCVCVCVYVCVLLWLLLYGKNYKIMKKRRRREPSQPLPPFSKGGEQKSGAHHIHI